MVRSLYVYKKNWQQFDDLPMTIEVVVLLGDSFSIKGHIYSIEEDACI